MKHLLYLAMCFLMAGSVTVKAQTIGVKPVIIDLWQNGLPNTNGIESQGYDDSKQNFKPTIYVYLPQIKSERPTKAVVVCPGGGYGGLAMNHEGKHWADFFLNEDVATIVLRYRMPHGNCDVPQSDAYEAIRQVKNHASEWNINPDAIGIMGFSAGGHLASTVATHAKADVIPAFQILFYPVISSDPAIRHNGSIINLLGQDASEAQLNLYSNDKQVTDHTPRAFIALSDDDEAVPPLNSARYYTALKEHKVPATMHVYPSGGHGWGINESFKYHTLMLEELRAWLHTF
ncbi:MAG: alpha/beta hydrolase [Phocaeicola sp.]|uniref:alpha/beta hydrolase n=1 Tax=Phocaeicola sp. TaxID=2773926 RepID=UPI003FA183DA